ncbi:MAG: tripartite tricarboxylate transporter substrate binding protein [Betaproteobacteria bacterium]|nr:tripartite tricarboxylate transporter substrate binding protein [Betaproteobacteria bacterium]
MLSRHWVGFLASFLLFPAGPLLAQPFPGKAVRIVIPFSLGGSSDITARVLVPHLAQRWKQQVIVDPRPGAASTVGTDYVAKSAADGHTILFSSTQYAYAPSTFARLPYDPLSDLVPVTLVTVSPQMIFAHPSLPVKTPKELVALARARPGELTLGTPGNTLPSHFFLSTAKVNITLVPYKGAGPLQTDVMGGHVPLGIAAISSVMGTLNSGRAKAIGVCARERTPLYPSAPPMAEAAPGFEAIAWFGMFVPRGTPPAVVKRIRDDITAVLKMPEVHKRLHEIGGDPSPMSSEDFTRWVHSEIGKWNKVAKAAGIKPM